jgi:hypothetical protein
LADLFAAVFLDDPCQGRGPDDHCLRQMDAFDGALFDTLLADTDPHASGQGVRNLVWALHRTDPQGLPKTFVSGVGALNDMLRASANQRPDGDGFAGRREGLERDFNLLTTLTTSLCAAMPTAATCSATERSRLMGQVDRGLLDTWSARAPSKIGAAGAQVTLDGKPVTLSFKGQIDDELGPTWTATVADGSQRSDYRVDFTGADDSGRTLTAELLPSENNSELHWSSDGALTR